MPNYVVKQRISVRLLISKTKRKNEGREIISSANNRMHIAHDIYSTSPAEMTVTKKWEHSLVEVCGESDFNEFSTVNGRRFVALPARTAH